MDVGKLPPAEHTVSMRAFLFSSHYFGTFFFGGGQRGYSSDTCGLSYYIIQHFRSPLSSFCFQLSGDWTTAVGGITGFEIYKHTEVKHHLLFQWYSMSDKGKRKEFNAHTSHPHAQVDLWTSHSTRVFKTKKYDNKMGAHLSSTPITAVCKTFTGKKKMIKAFSNLCNPIRVPIHFIIDHSYPSQPIQS